MKAFPHGTPERAAQLKALQVPDDFPCRGCFPKLADGVLVCPHCGDAFVFTEPGHAFHPNTPALAAALEETAEDMGRAAFHAGRMCAPALDPSVMKLMEGGSSLLPILKAWSHGWHSENLAAPVPCASAAN